MIFADFVTKDGVMGISKQRTVVVTDKRVFRIKKRDVKRSFKIGSIVALTKCVPPSKNETELVIHVRQERDFRINSKR